MSEIIKVLLVYTSITLTIIGAMLTFILYHFIPVKTKVETMWRDLYDTASGDGHIPESEGERETMRELLVSAEDRHEEMAERQARMLQYLLDLSEYLHPEQDEEEPPHIHEDRYIDVEQESPFDT